MAIADRIAEVEKGISYTTFQRLVKRLGVSEERQKDTGLFCRYPSPAQGGRALQP